MLAAADRTEIKNPNLPYTMKIWFGNTDLVRPTGLEPARLPIRPSNVRVCHSATAAYLGSAEYSLTTFTYDTIIRKKFKHYFFKLIVSLNETRLLDLASPCFELAFVFTPP